MIKRTFSSLLPVAAAATILAGGLFAQAPAAPKPYGEGAAKTESSGPAPKHDLSGVWTLRNPANMRQFSGATFDKQGPELTDWGKAEFAKAKSSNNGEYSLDTTNDPVLTRCAPPGTPRVYFHPYPFEFIQTPNLTLQIFEYDHTIRRIHTDGRALPDDPELSWMGTSVGKWEDDYTFVVDTNGLNERTWLDRVGHPHSSQLHVNERFHRVNLDHLEITWTMTDPKAMVKPWKATFYYELRPKWELGEISCSGDYLDFSKFEK